MHKKMVIVICIVLGLVGITSSLVVAQPPGDPDAANPGEPITGLIAVDSAFIYVGPDFAYDIIGQLPINASVTVLGRRGDFISRWDGNQWVQIQFGNREAWIYARLIRTSIPFNSIPPTGNRLVRDRNGRVPEGFDLSSDICSQWQGPLTQSGSLESGGITVTYPLLQGANLYTVIAIAPSGFRTPFFSTDGVTTITRDDLGNEVGTYTWRVAPYWTNSTSLTDRQQVCLLRTGGTFNVGPRPGSRSRNETAQPTPAPGDPAPAAQPNVPSVPPSDGGGSGGG